MSQQQHQKLEEVLETQSLSSSSTTTTAATPNKNIKNNNNATDDMKTHFSIWSGFHRKALQERRQHVKLCFPELSSTFTSLIEPSSSTTTNATTTTTNTNSSYKNHQHNNNHQKDVTTTPARDETAHEDETHNRTLDQHVNNLTKTPIIDAPQQEQVHVSPYSPWDGGLDRADYMIENCIGCMSLPLGLGLHFRINGVERIIPMVVEEPSIVAAVSGAAKTICKNGSFSTDSSNYYSGFSDENTTSTTHHHHPQIMVAQIQLLDIPDLMIKEYRDKILENKHDIIRFANTFCPNMLGRGGGVVNLVARIVQKRGKEHIRGGLVVGGGGGGDGVVSEGIDFNRAATTNDDLLVDQSLELLKSHYDNHLQSDNYLPSSSSWLIIHLHVDVCDAMGANICSTIAEGCAPYITQHILSPSPQNPVNIGLRIVSNLCPLRLVTSTFKIPVNQLEYKGISGHVMAARILDAYQWATRDVYRASTHNKGIMNGVDAVAIACGQDWRAIEAAAHVWANYVNSSPHHRHLDLDGSDNTQNSSCTSPSSYGPLTKYWVEKMPANQSQLDIDRHEVLYFCGQIRLPLAVGTMGGVLKSNPVYKANFTLMGNPNSQELAAIMASVGLAQNFAALRALVSEGIQRGHMSLHASNFAIAAGAPSHAVNECVAYMLESKRINLVAAKEYVTAHNLHEEISKLSSTADSLDGDNVSTTTTTTTTTTTGKMATMTSTKKKKKVDLLAPSMFYFAEDTPVLAPGSSSSTASQQQQQITLNIAFKSLACRPVYIELTSATISSFTDSNLVTQLLGDKTHAWITSIFQLLDQIRLSSIKPERKNVLLSKKLKLLSVLLNILVRRLMAFHPDETRRFLSKLLEKNGFNSSSLSSSSVFESIPLSQATGTSKSSMPPAESSSAEQTAPTTSPTPSSTITKIHQSQQTSPLGSTSSLPTIDINPVLAAILTPPPPITLLHSSRTVPSSSSSHQPHYRTSTSILGQSLEEIYRQGVGSSTGAADGQLQQEPNLLNVGLPLVFAIWQVFELRVNQWVGHRPLGNALLDEQSRVVRSLISNTTSNYSATGDTSTSSHHSGRPMKKTTPSEMLKNVMLLNSKRFQVTLFLMCDAISCDPQLITPDRLLFLRKLGAHLEWVQTIAHDLSPVRLARDLKVVFHEDQETSHKLAGEGQKASSLSYSSSLKKIPRLSRNGGLDYGDTVNSLLLFLHLEYGWSLKQICEKVVGFDDQRPQHQISTSTSQEAKEASDTSPSPLVIGDLDNQQQPSFFKHDLFSSSNSSSNHFASSVHDIFKTEIQDFIHRNLADGEIIYSTKSVLPEANSPAGGASTASPLLSSIGWTILSEKLPGEVFDKSRMVASTAIYRKYYCVETLFS